MPHLLRSTRLLPLLTAAFLAIACSDEVPSAPLAVASVRITPEAPALIVGQTLSLVATPLAASGSELGDRPVTWSSGDPGRATVAIDGTVTALEQGEVVITATSEGVSATVTLTIGAVPAALLVVDIGALVRNEGGVTPANAEVRSATGDVLEGRVVTWSSEDPAIATVTDAGVITAVSEGSTRIIARHAALEAAIDITVVPWFGAMLLFDSHDAATMTSRLYRADPRGVLGEQSPIFPAAGTWDAHASPTGDRVAFTCSSDGPAICTARLDGTDVRVLTGGDLDYEDEPAWSPDGARIAFRRRAQSANPAVWGDADIWVMNADGTGQANLTDDALAQHHPTWSPLLPGGSYRVAFAQGNVIGGYIISRIHSISADGTDRRPETEGGEYLEEEPTWSPDGRRIVFTRTGGTADGDLWSVDVTTGVEREFISYALTGAQRSPAWSPDGRHLVFASAHTISGDGGFRDQLFTVRADGTGLKRRTDGLVAKERPTWLAFP
jgi:hypothetical protein